jgi:hypothetical protein
MQFCVIAFRSWTVVVYLFYVDVFVKSTLRLVFSGSKQRNPHSETRPYKHGRIESVNYQFII